MSIGSEKTLMLTVMRNEGPYILEWVAHHFSIGFDDLLIFTNNCTDNTDLILDRLEVLMPHRIKHQPNPKVMFPDKGLWHVMALRYAGQFGRCRAADWLYVTDADEFLILKQKHKTLDDLMGEIGSTDAISFTSVAFNSNGQKEQGSGQVKKRFTQTTKDLKAAKNEGRASITAVKTLFRNSIEGPRRPHRPVTSEFSTTGKRWVNGSGDAMPAEWTDAHNKGIEANGTRKHAQLNHYIIKSAAEFLLKVDRGDAVHAERLGKSAKYWNHANTQGDVDKSGTTQSRAARALFSEFLSDPVLRALHEESLELRERRLSEILKTEQGDNLARAIGYYD